METNPWALTVEEPSGRWNGRGLWSLMEVKWCVWYCIPNIQNIYVCVFAYVLLETHMILGLMHGRYSL